MKSVDKYEYTFSHKDEDDNGYSDHPMTVENGDYYTNSTVYGFTEMIKGDALVNFLKQNGTL